MRLLKKIDFAKVSFFAACASLVFAYGVAVGAYDIFPHALLAAVKNDVTQVLAERQTLAKTKPEHFLQPAFYQGNGVTLNALPAGRDDLVLIDGFFDDSNELRLIRRNGDIVARWPVRLSALFPDTSHIAQPPGTDWNVDTHGALALSDGSVVFNFEYGGLVKLDRCGKTVWTLPRMTHHSVEKAEGGGYWVPSRYHHLAGEKSPFPPFETPFREDTILKVSEDGKVLKELSVPRMFYDSGLEALLTGSGEMIEAGMHWDHEIVHLNKVEELTREMAPAFPMFEAGDLLISMRKLNLLAVADPESGRIKWWQTGPWLRQHDPEFRPDGTIVLFNNNVYRTELGKQISFRQAGAAAPRRSNILVFHPATRQTEILYGNRDDDQLLSVIRGKIDATENGGWLVTEFEGGRVFEIDAAGKVIWEFVNRYSDDEIAEITEARAYPSSYFTVKDWSCEGLRN